MRLTRHHGLGNDFLVLIDDDGQGEPGADVARWLCDRHTGVGADGLLVATPGGDGADLTMVLRNADGSRAEMSGNGIRCLVQAARLAGVVDGPVVRVATDAGLRTVSGIRDVSPTTIEASVDMGVIGPGRVEWEGSGPPPAESMAVDAGNPHLVRCYADRPTMDAAADRTAALDPPLNVEHVTVAPGDVLDMRVVERGVGETLACGTGACAAAWAARQWGHVGNSVAVRMPGGEARVDLDGDHATLTGPAVLIARLEVVRA